MSTARVIGESVEVFFLVADTVSLLIFHHLEDAFSTAVNNFVEMREGFRRWEGALPGGRSDHLPLRFRRPFLNRRLCHSL